MQTPIPPWLAPVATDQTLELLLVEDDEVDAEIVRRMIRQLPDRGWTILWATSLAEALTILEDHRPLVALIDLTLPDARHLEAVRAIQQAAPRCALIVQTGLDNRQLTTEALKLGAQDYLTKGTLTTEALERSIRHSILRYDSINQLSQTSDALAQTDEDLDDFAHVVAHDLRAPVRTARMLADRLIDQSNVADPMVHLLGRRLDVALARVDGMILSMLDYAALRGSMPTPVAVSVKQAATSARAALNADLETLNATIDHSIDPSIHVSASADLLDRVLQNLLTNAIKYRRDDVDPEVKVWATVVGHSVEIRVKDNGKGITSADAERVFDILERLDPAAADGLGFGLAICRRIVNGFGGAIEIEPGAGEGTTVLISLPRADAPKPAPSAASVA